MAKSDLPNRNDRIEEKLDKIADRISAIDVTLGAQHVSLKDHIRRTELLEANLQPVQLHVARVGGAFKLIGVLATVSGLIAALVEIAKGMK